MQLTLLTVSWWPYVTSWLLYSQFHLMRVARCRPTDNCISWRLPSICRATIWWKAETIFLRRTSTDGNNSTHTNVASGAAQRRLFATDRWDPFPPRSVVLPRGNSPLSPVSIQLHRASVANAADVDAAKLNKFAVWYVTDAMISAAVASWLATNNDHRHRSRRDHCPTYCRVLTYSSRSRCHFAIVIRAILDSFTFSPRLKR